MRREDMVRWGGSVAALLLAACTTAAPDVPVDRESAAAGGTVTRRGAEVQLLGSGLAVGSPLPSAPLTDSRTMETVDLAQQRGKVLLISTVVSLETGV